MVVFYDTYCAWNIIDEDKENKVEIREALAARVLGFTEGE